MLLYTLFLFTVSSRGVIFTHLSLDPCIFYKREQYTRCFSHNTISILFLCLKYLNFPDLVTSLIAVFMSKFCNNLLPSVFDTFFTRINQMNNYNSRLSNKLSYSLPKVRTNYGMYNITFKVPQIWNSIDEALSFLNSRHLRKRSNLTLLKITIAMLQLCIYSIYL